MSAGGWQPAGKTLAETQQAAHLGLNTPHRDVDGVDGAHILVSADVHVHQLLPFDLNKFGDNLQFDGTCDMLANTRGCDVAAVQPAAEGTDSKCGNT